MMQYSYFLSLLSTLVAAASASQSLEVAPAVCNDPADFKGHADINPWHQNITAWEYCTGSWYQKSMDPNSEPLHNRGSMMGVHYE